MNKEPRQLRIGVLGCGPISQAETGEPVRLVDATGGV